MKTVFRKLNQKRSWDIKRAQWLRADGVQADALQCLSTRHNKLSVYVLEDTEVQIRKVVAALALTRNNLGEVDWAVFSEGTLERLEINWDEKEGETPDGEVNGWHRDLVELDARKVVELAAAIQRDGRVGRSQPIEVKRAIIEAVGRDSVVRDKIDKKLIGSLRNKGIMV